MDDGISFGDIIGLGPGRSVNLLGRGDFWIDG